MKYVAGTDLTFEVPLVDDAGVSVDATAVSYTLFDQNGVELVPVTAISGYSAGTDATVTVAAEFNAVAAGGTREGRGLIFQCTTENGIVLVSHTYILETVGGSLIRGLNTVVTMTAAEVLASEMTGLNGWMTVTKQEKTNALIEAYSRLGKLRYTFLSDTYDDQRRVYLPLRRNLTSLQDLTIDQVLGLEEKILLALSCAQVAEADSILSGDPVEASRQRGLILDTIGEVKQMYRSSKPIELPISRKALNYVSAYTTLGSKVLSRA